MPTTVLDTQPAESNLRSADHGSSSFGARAQTRGKFLDVAGQKLYVRGVTYGTFAPGSDGRPYPDQDQVRADFSAMSQAGINCVRTYTVPPTWLLDTAQNHGLRVMVGLAWEQHVTFLDDPNRARSIQASVRSAVRECAGHPAVLAYVVGNEIPANIVRWHGRRAVERFIRSLYDVVKQEDPHSLVTYVNYPSTEYLNLPFLDFLSFNVYLEEEERLDAYLARLQNQAGDRPLVLAEIGLDSRSKGEYVQAQSLEWQLRTTFAAGCAGAFVFAWTDEWHRGGHDIQDWDFGLTTRDRRPKSALGVTARVFREIPFPANRAWPRMSVVVCSYNGSRTIRACLDGLLRLEYANYEVIMVNDGSADTTPAIMREYPFRYIGQINRGLSAARNVGLAAASGEIVAYIDDDAVPDPHWLQYLAHTYLEHDYAVVGGPNIPPPDDTPMADCVANAPGGPLHVLVSDRDAEHVPGCNLSARTAALRAINGFDETFRVAGDDVDVCWRVQERGWKLGFSHGAMVWHKRRDSIRGYWKQQQGYGKAEALLERKWPMKYTRAGHVSWGGRLYGRGLLQHLPLSRSRIYHGQWGLGLFQLLYQPSLGTVESLPLMPEWYLIIVSLAVASGVGLVWTPLLITLPLLMLTLAITLAQATLGAARASFSKPFPTGRAHLRWRATVGLLHLIQPLARLTARLRYGLTVWRARHSIAPHVPRLAAHDVWSEGWRPSDAWLHTIEARLRGERATVARGNEFDPWDLEVRPGVLAGARVLMTIEEHGGAGQLLRFRIRPVFAPLGIALASLCAVLATLAALDGVWIACGLLGLLAGASTLALLHEWGSGYALLRKAIGELAPNQDVRRNPSTIAAAG